MVGRFGRWGNELYSLCRGQDDRPVEPNRIRKSLSNECTYSENLTSLTACRTAIDELIVDLEAELQQKAPQRSIRKAFVKVKFSDFTRTDQRMSELARPGKPFKRCSTRLIRAAARAFVCLALECASRSKAEEAFQSLMSF